MDGNKALIEKFYTAFQQKDVLAMQNCYADNAVFNDPVFSNLNAEQVRAMWAMLIKSGKDMRVEFKNITGSSSGGTAEWIAYYTFSATGNRVTNRIKASFFIENGKIVRHTDRFSFYKWASQSLGLTGILLGWTGLLRNKISSKAKNNLELYMTARQTG